MCSLAVNHRLISKDWKIEIVGLVEACLTLFVVHNGRGKEKLEIEMDGSVVASEDESAQDLDFNKTFVHKFLDDEDYEDTYP